MVGWFVVGSLTKNSNLAYEVVFSWKQLDYQFKSLNQRNWAIENKSFIPENNIITGVKVFGNRIFLSVPRWREGVPSTLNYVDFNETSNPSSSPLIPYPSWEYQEVGNCTSFQYVQSMEIDQFGRMWVLDVGRVNIFTKPQNKCPPKLLIIDVTKDEVLKYYAFPENVVSHTTSFLNDLVVGCSNLSKEGCWAYITDSGDGKLVIYSLKDNTRKIYTLNGNIDAIALSPFDSKFDRVYYHPLSSRELFSVSTSVLQNASNCTTLSKPQVFRHGWTSSQSDGMVMDAQGNLYFGKLTTNALVYINASQKQMDESFVAQNDEDLQWVDTFGFDNQGYLYMTTNRMQRFESNTLDFGDTNFRVVRVFIGSKSCMYSAGKEGYIKA
ncbi:Protein yellow [Orchesella cincta]|uniref:Protein yellow n=1 Tax=Orchesella cincta TaxID=48709 RepID=A0A1D2MGM7_ORCCI|nr:Protein yellow [Orchesella cincta]